MRGAHATRITPHMSPLEMAAALGEGNPGALTTCALLLREGEALDPDAWHGGLACLLGLDSLGLYGPAIWELRTRACRGELRLLVAVLRAVQLGLRTPEEVLGAVTGGTPLDPEAAYRDVRAALPGFDPMTPRDAMAGAVP